MDSTLVDEDAAERVVLAPEKDPRPPIEKGPGLLLEPETQEPEVVDPDHADLGFEWLKSLSSGAAMAE